MRLSFPMCTVAVVLAACAVDEDVEDLGQVSDGKGDAPEIRDRAITLKKKTASGGPSSKTYRIGSDVDFRVELRYAGTNETRITVTAVDDASFKVQSPRGVQPTLTVDALQGDHEYRIKLEHYGAADLPAKLSVLGDAAVPAELLDAARANLARVAKEIDYRHLGEYGLSGSIQNRFLEALQLEYADNPDQLLARAKALASMVFFAAPEIVPPASGKLTPFHGLDMSQFETLMSIEDQVFNALVARNGGSLVGVRPFSVCETKFMIETYVRPRASFPGFEAHRAAYAAHAPSCPQADRDEWYNFRGLGHLRPTWVESNVMDRFLRRMLTRCEAPTAAWVAPCARFAEDRLAYRRDGNRQLASRLLMYAPEQESLVEDVYQPLVLAEDRDGDGVGEFFKNGPAKLKTGTDVTLEIVSTGEFTGSLRYRKPDGTTATIAPEKVVAESAVHPDFDAAMLDLPDFGLQSLFADPTGCEGATLDPEACPLLKRFYVLIDRHEYFYRTYSSLAPDRASLSSQPSPLVACSITLTAAHHWDSAGIPEGGTAGFIFLMRIPFAQILAGSDRSVATLEPGPDVLSIQDLYRGDELDLDKVWLDIASLSNNLYSSEHEISKFGAVPAEQIEGILVVRRPAAMP